MMVLARSKAGHDKNHVYLVWKEDETYVYLVNGSNRKLGNPKKKKKMHVQIIKKLPRETAEFLEPQEPWKDESIARMLELYHRRNENVESRCY